MGLDIYLYKNDVPLVEILAVEKDYDEKSDAIWKEVGEGRGYDDMTQEEKDEASKRTEELKKAMGLGKWGTHPGQTKIETNSKTYPKHLFKIGYFRSSYNEGGINSHLQRMGLPDLYWVFEPGDEHTLIPDWKAVHERIRVLITRYTKEIEKPEGIYDATFIVVDSIFKQDPPPPSENEALKVFKGQLEGHKDKKPPLGSYFCKEGHFWLEGWEIFALIPGVGCMDQRGVYVIFKRKSDNGDWYLQALEIIKETIEWVLDQADTGSYCLHWSG